MAQKAQLIFEKFAALIFLFILVGLIAFLVYVPMPLASEKVILIIIGGLMSTAAGALPRLFGSDDSKEKELQERLQQMELNHRSQMSAMEIRLKEVQAEYVTIKSQYDDIVKMLIDRHVVPVVK